MSVSRQHLVDVVRHEDKVDGTEAKLGNGQKHIHNIPALGSKHQLGKNLVNTL